MLIDWNLFPYGLKYSEDLIVVSINISGGSNYMFSIAQQPVLGQKLLNTAASLSHS
jgi:hypothetical protein